MTTVAVLADPPQPGGVLSSLAASTPLSEAEAAELYEALLKDAVLAVDRSGGELLVNYRAAGDVGYDGDPEAALRAVVSDVLDPDSVRFEPQVGGPFASRVGNTATHLLESEGVGSVGIVRPEAARFARTDIDSAAMKLRTTPVVVGPAPGGRVCYAAFRDPIDYADCYARPALGTLTDRALEAGLDVGFLESKPYLETASDLAGAIVSVRARRRADAIVPPYFAAWIEQSDLAVSGGDGGLTLER